MRRADTALVVIVGALAVFVIAMVAKRPPATRPAPDTHETPLMDSAPVAPRNEISANQPPPSAPAPRRDEAEIGALIRETPGTYMADMLADLGDKLVRWPDRRDGGLRIWVQSVTSVRDFEHGYAQAARDAFDDWGREPLPIRFDFILDSASADVRVVWLDRFPAESGTRVGITLRNSDRNGWLREARIDVAIHDSAGRTIPPRGLEGILRHEAGHALGMGHSSDQSTKMFPIEVTHVITPADRATLRLLYRLPPGPLRLTGPE